MCWFLFNRGGGQATWGKAVADLRRSAVHLEQDLETFTTGEAGILVRPGQGQGTDELTAVLERALGASEMVRSHGYRLEPDSMGFVWIIMRGSALPDLISVAEAAGDTLVSLGVGGQVVVGVFPFTWKDQRIYWLYQPRVRGFTPFVPHGQTEEEERDHELEVRMAAALHKRIPVVKELSEWYPVWDRPF